MEMKDSKQGGFTSGSIIAAACIVIYLFALIQGTVRIYLSLENRKVTAEKEFESIASAALYAGTQGFMDQNFIRAMNNALSTSKSIEALIITGADNGYTFEKQEGHAITWVNNSPRFNNKFSFLKQDLYKPLPIPDVRNANIQAIAGAFDYDDITTILKETLIIILIGFAIAFFTMLFQLLIKKPLKGTMVHTDKSKKEPVRIYEENQSVFNETQSSPKGLYSQRTNIGWEEYIKDRLDSELHRCSSTEKDLSLLLIEFINITNDDMFKNIADIAVNFFTSRDLLFEYGRWGIAAILPGSELDVSISKSEKFHQRVAEKFPGSFVTANTGAWLCIGLTSRSGRLLNADRLMLEAREALKKAKSENASSIIAFKSDPEKYRAFIASQN